jgi:hypothetical protein
VYERSGEEQAWYGRLLGLRRNGPNERFGAGRYVCAAKVHLTIWGLTSVSADEARSIQKRQNTNDLARRRRSVCMRVLGCGSGCRFICRLLSTFVCCRGRNSVSSLCWWISDSCYFAYDIGARHPPIDFANSVANQKLIILNS